MSIWRFDDLFDAPPAHHRVTLGEGGTPMIASRRIGPAAGLHRLFFKIESANPTGSYKDRFAAAAVSHMRATGRTQCLATSSGNTGAALAAYCAAAGMTCHIAAVESAPEGKLRQMLAYGANVFRVNQFGRDAAVTRETFRIMTSMAAHPQRALQISAFRYSPSGMQGVMTMSYEIVEQAPQKIDHVFVPAGGGGLLLALARGFAVMSSRDHAHPMPAVHCVQPEGNDTIAGPLRQGTAKARTVTCTTEVSGLQVPEVVDGDEVIAACRASQGTGHVVSDDAVWRLTRRLACEEGIFCEPAGAVALAGALKAAERREIAPEDTVVCIVTGSGFKDPVFLDRMLRQNRCPTLDVCQIESHLTDPD